MKRAWRFATQAVHAGSGPDVHSGAVMMPIYQSSTFAQSEPGIPRGYEYGRVSNPTRTALEQNLAALEGATHGIAFASGLAAADAILKCLRPGDHVLCSNDLYGGSYRLLRTVYGPLGIRSSFVDMRDVDRVGRAIGPNTKLFWLETPGNPLLHVIDIAATAQVAKRHGAHVVVDNTFATPFLQRPLELGADLVLHSTTKYVGGHSDVIGGAICTNNAQWETRLRFQVKCAGAVPGPMDCFLLLRGAKTLHVRMERHCANARHLAVFLGQHPKVDRVYYPGLASHPGYEVAKHQMSDFGGMIAFTLMAATLEDTLRVLAGCEVFTLAESLGGVESLIGHPATMTHASIPREERIAAGLGDNVLRLSVGLEDVRDLENDLAAALATA